MLGGDEVMKIDSLGNHLHLLPELAKLHFDEWRHFSPDQTLEDRVVKLRTIAQSGDVPFIVVAIDNNQLIGSSALVNEDMSTRKDLSPWLASVFVKPGFRKNGVGTSLVRYIEGEAQKRGIQKLFLYTEHARNLYAALGWHDLEECEYQGVGVAIMYKKIAT
jgi:N-acetylglutamate synthase-like GNAT family acetyltransferase